MGAFCNAIQERIYAPDWEYIVGTQFGTHLGNIIRNAFWDPFYTGIKQQPPKRAFVQRAKLIKD